VLSATCTAICVYPHTIGHVHDSATCSGISAGEDGLPLRWFGAIPNPGERTIGTRARIASATDRVRRLTQTSGTTTLSTTLPFTPLCSRPCVDLTNQPSLPCMLHNARPRWRTSEATSGSPDGPGHVVARESSLSPGHRSRLLLVMSASLPSGWARREVSHTLYFSLPRTPILVSCREVYPERHPAKLCQRRLSSHGAQDMGWFR
jgi:hypothetical protein